jgi:transposase-like protein
MRDATRAKWSELVRRWSESGLTAAEFARREGLNAGTLSYWKWRRRREGRRTALARRGSGRAPTFVEVVAPLPAVADRIEVVVDGKHVVRVPDGFDEATLRRVIAVVQERP